MRTRRVRLVRDSRLSRTPDHRERGDRNRIHDEPDHAVTSAPDGRSATPAEMGHRVMP